MIVSKRAYNPLLSIVTPTYNNELQINSFLASVYSQFFPKDKLELIISDGGSYDATLLIAKRYPVKIIHNNKKHAEEGIDLGMRKARGSLIMILAVDNYFKRKDSLQRMVKVFENKNVYAAFPRHASKKNYSLFSKYINKFTDPFNHFIYQNAANARTFSKIYKSIKKNDLYEVFDFNSHPNKPLMALAQGFTVRRDYEQKPHEVADDITPVLRIIKEKKMIAYVHSVDLYHETISSWRQFFRKQRWATHTTLIGKKRGIKYREKFLSIDQKRRIALWPFYSLLFFPAFGYGIYKAVKEREKLWLFHPVISFFSALASFYEVVLLKLGMSRNLSRK